MAPRRASGSLMEFCWELLWKPPVLPAELVPYYGQQDKDKGFKRPRSWEQETVVAAKQMVSCLVHAAFGTLQTRCREERSGRRAGRSWSLTWKFKKLLVLGFAATKDWELYSVDNLCALTWRGHHQHRSYLYLICTHNISPSGLMVTPLTQGVRSGLPRACSTVYGRVQPSKSHILN